MAAILGEGWKESKRKSIAFDHQGGWSAKTKYLRISKTLASVVIVFKEIECLAFLHNLYAM